MAQYANIHTLMKPKIIHSHIAVVFLEKKDQHN